LDRAEFEELYATYLPKVYNYVCYRVNDVTAAEDITAEVFERALSRLHTYRADQSAFSTWLFTIAHNLVANYQRARKRRPEEFSLESLPALSVGGISLEHATAEAEQLRQIHAYIKQLPEQQQEVLALKFGGGMSNQEIAKAMGLKPNYVGVLLYRAVRALRLDLEEAEVSE
jgi:RNA polymerase sigma-70 factor (ECF subfamily)